MPKKILLAFVMTSFVFLAGCGSSAKESAERVVEAINKKDWDTTWNITSEESHNRVGKQLDNLKASPMGKSLIVRTLGISDGEIDNLTPKSYFAAIMNLGMATNPANTELISVETNGNIATITTSKGGVKTKSEMIKEGSDWKLRITMPD